MKGLLGRDRLETIIAMISRYGLPTEVPVELDRDLIKSYLLTDKKRVGSRTSFVLAVDIGEVVISDEVGETEIDAVINA
jgi:3-dehydroquinate synthase